MKIGITYTERRKRMIDKAGSKIVFAFLPKYIVRTERWVWLERVKKIVQYDSGWHDNTTRYDEL